MHIVIDTLFFFKLVPFLFPRLVPFTFWMAAEVTVGTAFTWILHHSSPACHWNRKCSSFHTKVLRPLRVSALPRGFLFRNSNTGISLPLTFFLSFAIIKLRFYLCRFVKCEFTGGFIFCSSHKPLLPFRYMRSNRYPAPIAFLLPLPHSCIA